MSKPAIERPGGYLGDKPSELAAQTRGFLADDVPSHRYADYEGTFQIGELRTMCRGLDAYEMLKMLRANDGECLGDHPDWLKRIDEIVVQEPDRPRDGETK